MRISYWGSDVCSSDLARGRRAFLGALAGDDQRAAAMESRLIADRGREDVDLQRGAAPAHAKVGGRLREKPARAGGAVPSGTADPVRGLEQDRSGQIGRASCRERGCQYV